MMFAFGAGKSENEAEGVHVGVALYHGSFCNGRGNESVVEADVERGGGSS